MTTPTRSSTAANGSDEERLSQWIEQHVGGQVVRIEPLRRWRMAWNIDVDMGHEILRLHARSDREPNFAIPNRVIDEAPIHDLLEAHGLPVPHNYGICDDPQAMVIGWLPGEVDLSFAADDADRAALIEQYLSLLPAMYAIGPDDLARAGLDVPPDGSRIGLHVFARWERVYDEHMRARDPIAEFLRGWLHRNHPDRRVEPTFITFDAFQFLFEQGRITGLIDFELCCVGDPLMDLAALRVRDTIKNLGDLSQIAQQFEDVTGLTVDQDAVDYYAVLYNTLTVMSAAPSLAAPLRTVDYVSHLAWYTNSARWSLEIIADIAGFRLDPVSEPETAPTHQQPAFDHLVAVLGARSSGVPADYEASTAFRLARHVRRVHEIGTAVAEADRADVEELAGAAVALPDVDDVLLAFVDRHDPQLDEPLVRLLDRRAQRRHLTLGPPGSLLLRHPRLRSLRPDAVGDGYLAVDDEAQRWPAGSIPGTR